jgi:hypothetical protein
MTMLRHPIERVISSYRMIRNTFLNEPDWNMKAWLLHSAMPRLNQTATAAQSFQPKSRRLGISKRIIGSPKPLPHKPQAPNSVAVDSPISRPTRTRSPPPRILPTDGLDENYMTKWLCGRWSQFHSSPATEECYLGALANLNKFDFVFLTESLSSDLPLTAKLLGLNVTKSSEHVSFLSPSSSRSPTPPPSRPSGHSVQYSDA